MTSRRDDTLIVAIGSSHGDDQAAWRVADLLDLSLHEISQIRKASVPLNMINWLSGVERLHIIDACAGGGKIGDLLRIEWTRMERGRRETSVRADTLQHSSSPAVTDTDDPSESGGKGFQLSMLRAVGTHDFDVPSVLDLSAKLSLLPRCVTIWAIIGRNFAPHQAMSTVVESQLPLIAQTIRKEVINARAVTGEVAAEAG